MPSRNAFGDYPDIDLSSIYAASGGPGTTTGSPDPGASGGGSGGAGGSGGSADPLGPGSYPVSPLIGNPAATVDETTAYWAQVAAGLLNGDFSPYEYTTQARGQNGSGRPGQSDGSPEANLPGDIYAATVLNGVLTPEQRSQIQYNSPAFAQWLESQVAAGRGDSIGLTRAIMQNHLNSGSYGGSAEDLGGAIQTARQSDYAQYVARLRASGITNIPTQADYERGMGLKPPGTPVVTGQQTTPTGHALYGAPVTANTPDYTETVKPSFAAAGIAPPAPPASPAVVQQPAAPTVDYAAKAATALQYSKNLAASDPVRSQMYADRAAEYEGRIAQPSTASGTV